MFKDRKKNQGGEVRKRWRGTKIEDENNKTISRTEGKRKKFRRHVGEYLFVRT